jgi:3-hydroxyisobutyrate dehydrogenase-like beta-hydroxyacid dehydrogenase
MGHAVGRVLREHGHDVVSFLGGRSEHTCKLAMTAGIRDTQSLAAVVTQADMILSILPPASALGQAKAVAAAMAETGSMPVYVDCNAVSPQTVLEVGNAITTAGAAFIDAGIIGLAPGKGATSRFYVSGHDLEPMTSLNGKGIAVIRVGSEIGRASSLKMAYAGLTKGTWTLQTAVLLAAQQLGVLRELLDELRFSQADVLSLMQSRIPRLPADSGRWVGEMEEIAATFAGAGVPSGFHKGAAEIFRVLSKSSFASETRETMDTSRSLEAALLEYARHLPKSDV